MKTKYLSLLTLALATSLFFACDSPDTTQNEESAEETSEETMAQEEEAKEETAMATALMINHEVKDFDQWKAEFDKHKSARTDANLSDWALLTDRDNPNMVTFIAKVGDMEAANAFINSEDLKSKMEGAGVIGKPNIRFAKVEVIDKEAGKASDVRLYVEHKVEDYAKWKEVFDSKADLHEANGISPVAVAYDMKDKNSVTVVSTADDFETLEKFVNNSELKAAMKDAGVVGKPVFNYRNIHMLKF